MVAKNPEKLPKKHVPATIQTLTQTIRGNIHVREWERVKNMLETASELWLAVTDVEIFNSRNEVVHRCAFIAINKSHILWVDPNESDISQITTE